MLDWYAQPQYRSFAMTHDDAADSRPGALLIHGFTGTPDELRPTARIAHEAGFDVEAILLPGHGADIAAFRTVPSGAWRDETLRAWRAFRERYRRAVLVGYSLGGALAIHAAAEHAPEAMLLLAPLVRIADRRAVALPVAQRVIREMAPFRKLDFSLPQVRSFFHTARPGLEIERPEVQEAIRTEFVIPTRLLNECRLAGREAGRLAGRVTAPTTIIQGRPDDIVGHRNTRWLVDRLGGPVAYHEIPGDHLVPMPGTASWPAVRRLVAAWFDDRYGELTG